VVVAVLAQQFVPAEALPVGVAMVVAVVGVVAVLLQQFLHMEVVLIGVGVAVAVAVVEMVECCPLTLVMFLVESGPNVPLHCMFPQTQVLSFLAMISSMNSS